jgi:hypothetical protein
MKIAIAQEDALIGAKLEFMCVKRAEIWPTRAPEGMKTTIVGFLMEKTLKRRRVIKYLGGESVYEIHSHKEGFIPILEWHTNMSKQDQVDLNYMMVFVLGRPVLLMSIGTRNIVRNINLAKERMKLLVLTTLNRFGLQGFSCQTIVQQELEIP